MFCETGQYLGKKKDGCLQVNLLCDSGTVRASFRECSSRRVPLLCFEKNKMIWEKEFFLSDLNKSPMCLVKDQVLYFNFLNTEFLKLFIEV